MSFARETQDILHYGKRYMLEEHHDAKTRYLKMAARLVANAEHIEKKLTLLWWWEEGIREHCETNKQVDDIIVTLREEAVRHIVEGRS